MGKNLTTSEPDIYKLAVFDFDETLVDDELSDYILNSGNQQSKIIVPCEINAIYEAWNWPFRMNALFKFLRNKHDITSADIIKHVAKIRVSDSLKDLIRLLKSNNYKLVIISDCNSLFIGNIFNNHHLPGKKHKLKLKTNRYSVKI
jgi:phosphoserine phosphatase